MPSHFSGGGIVATAPRSKFGIIDSFALSGPKFGVLDPFISSLFKFKFSGFKKSCPAIKVFLVQRKCVLSYLEIF